MEDIEEIASWENDEYQETVLNNFYHGIGVKWLHLLGAPYYCFVDGQRTCCGMVKFAGIVKIYDNHYKLNLTT